MDGLIERFRDRHLIRWGIGYAAGAWAFLQVLDFLAETFDLGTGVVRGATIVLTMGFFVVLVVAWFHGERGRQKVTWAEVAILAVIMLLTVVGLRVLVSDPRSNEAPAAADTPSIAVLPFVNFSPDPADAYLAGGLTEEITSQLSRVDGIRVLNRVAVERVAVMGLPLDSVARQLGARSFLSGSVRKDGEAVRISAALVDAATNANTWEDSFDRSLSDVFEMQTEIALSIATSLRRQLGESEVSDLTEAPTTSPVAYDLYLRAGALRGNIPEEARSAIALLKAALAADSLYVDAWAELGWKYTWLVRLGDENAGDSALAFTRRAVELEPTSTRALSLLGGALQAVGLIQEAMSTWEEGLRLDPGNALFAPDYSYFLSVAGQEALGLDLSLQAVGDDPGDPNLWWHSVAPLRPLDRRRASAWLELGRATAGTFSRLTVSEMWFSLEEGRPDTAVLLADSVLDAYPGEPEVTNAAAVVLLLVGEPERTTELLATSARLFPDQGIIWLPLTVGETFAMALHQTGRTTEALALFEAAERRGRAALERGETDPHLFVRLAGLHAVQGDSDGALVALQRAAELGYRRPGWMMLNPFFESIRDEPTFGAILERMEGDLELQRAQAEESGAFALIDAVLAGADPRGLYRPEGIGR